MLANIKMQKKKKNTASTVNSMAKQQVPPCDSQLYIDKAQVNSNCFTQLTKYSCKTSNDQQILKCAGNLILQHLITVVSSSQKKTTVKSVS